MTKIATNGVQIHYDEQGQGEPLVLLMGLGAYGRKWEQHLAVYKKHFRCILIDNRGAGQSEKPEIDAYTTELMAKDALGVLDALAIEKAHFHGISMGGAIAQIIAARRPELVRSLILTSTFAKASVFFTRALEILRDSIGVLDGATFSHLCQYMIYAAQYHEKHLDEMIAAEKQDEADPFPMPAYAYRAQCNACIKHDSREILHMIQAPTLVAAGASDLFAPLDAAMQLVKGIKGAQLYLCENGGHVHHWEQLEEFNRVTLNFLLAHKGKKGD